jgi:hypothetical protein
MPFEIEPRDERPQLVTGLRPTSNKVYLVATVNQ